MVVFCAASLILGISSCNEAIISAVSYTHLIVTDEDNNLNILTQLFRGKTVEEKELAVNMLKLLFSYTDGKI